MDASLAPTRLPGAQLGSRGESVTIVDLATLGGLHTEERGDATLWLILRLNRTRPDYLLGSSAGFT
jgi:chemotaxis signal transduction protein